jgi:hypothetical protein
MFSFDDPAFLASMVDPLWIVAGAAPIVDLPLARNRSLTDVISGQNLITYSRVGNGTYVDSDRILKTGGTNVPLFDHDPVTGESLGLLARGQDENLNTYSEALDNAAWNIIGGSVTVSPNVAIAPDGLQTADKVIETTTTGSHSIETSGSPFQAGTAYTYSIFMKAAERARARINFPTSFTNRLAVVDVGLSTFGVISAGGMNVRIMGPYPNDLFRVVSTSTATTTTAGARIGFSLVNTGTNVSYTGDGVSGLFAWGSKLNTGTEPGDYILTTDSAVTRNADFADLIDAAIANNIRTLYLEFRSPAVGTRGVVSLNDDTANERASLITSGTDPRLVVVDGGVEQANIDGGTITAGTRTRVAVRIGANNFAISTNGGAVVTDTSGTMPTVNRLMLGRTQAGEWLNSRLARVTGWSELLPDATMQALSQ